MAQQQVMAEKENISAPQVKERKSSLTWNKEVLIFVVLPIVLTILFPLGGIFYLYGRTSWHMGLLFLIYPLIGFFIIFCFIAGIIGLLRDLGKQNRAIITHVAEIIIPIVFVTLFIIPYFIPIELGLWSPDKAFNYGFRERIRSKADIPAIRDWLKTLHKEDFMDSDDFGDPDIRLFPEQLPKSLKVFHSGYVKLNFDKSSNPQIDILWGGATFHWGVTIGMEDMEMTPPDFKGWAESWLLVEPGVYVYTF
jgi:hypothetical protein